MQTHPSDLSSTCSKSRLIERIYDAACGTSEWPSALDVLASSFDSLCATYFLWRKGGNSLGFFQHSHGYAGDEVYRAHYSTLDPRRKVCERLPEGSIMRCHEYLDENFIRRSEFYQDFSLPNGRRFLMSATLVKTESKALYAVLHRTSQQGRFTNQDATQFTQLTPHLRRAAKIQVKMEEVEAARRASDITLDQLTFGLITVDQAGHVLSMNRAAEDIIRNQDGLRVHRGSLAADQSDESTTLLHCIRRAVAAGAEETPRQGASLLITRPSGRGAYRILVAPLSEEAATRFESKFSRTALVMVRDPDTTTLPPEQHLVSLFGLTPAEAQVALALLSGKRLEEVAEERAVSLGTVRSQFKAILRKTEVDRQAELVRALLAVPTIRGSM